MGLLKTAATLIMGATIFYSGILYERWDKKDDFRELKSQIKTMQTIDYKITSLMVDMATQPEKVNESFYQFDNLMQNPSMLEQQLHKYQLELK